VPGLTKAELHERLVVALGARVEPGSLDDVPLLIGVSQIAVPLAIWAFTLTNPPGGRHPAESKIQLIMPEQGRGEPGNFEGPVGSFKLLVGVHPGEDLFVLWDAYKYKDFAWSRNVQVRGPLLWDASVSGMATGTRNLATGLETVIVARGDHLIEAVKQRIGSP
jgi:restriction-modification system family protein